jgi:hypothetical protein
MLYRLFCFGTSCKCCGHQENIIACYLDVLNLVTVLQYRIIHIIAKWMDMAKFLETTAWIYNRAYTRSLIAGPALIFDDAAEEGKNETMDRKSLKKKLLNSAFPIIRMSVSYLLTQERKI